jgi:tRNA uridine 5-carboxymethylaminomethyl modification enzyme
LLREDNAALRLTTKGRELGVVGDYRWRMFCEYQEIMERTINKLHDTQALELLKRPEVNYQNLSDFVDLDLPIIPQDVALQIEIQSKYAGYIDRQKNEVMRLHKAEQIKLASNLDYSKVIGLSSEVMQKLSKIKPHTIAQAQRISGITPAAISLLLVYVKKQKLLYV